MNEFSERLDYEDDEFEDDADSQKDKYITFKLDKEEFGIEIQYVIEIVGLQKITQLPDMPEFIKGVINLRGLVIPILDVRKRFRLEEIPYNDRTCIIVVSIQEAQLGLIVDEVSEVLDIPESQVSEPPKTSIHKSRYIKGIGKVGNNVKIILNIEKILSEEEMNEVIKVAWNNY